MSELFNKPPGVVTRWVSFENPAAEKGQGGLKNRGGKGRPCETLGPGKKLTLVDLRGPGVIRRIWLTTSEVSVPLTMRSLTLEMFWEGEKVPAVAAPLNDFFGMGLGRKAPFESALFSDPEGKSFNCFVPMPFRKRAKIVLSNHTKKNITVFFEVDVTLGDPVGKDALYFHACFRRENPTKLSQDFEVLPKVSGAGRFLGMNIGLSENPLYHGGWFGEGEVKIYLDGDGKNPTLCGTGTEDYIGTAWGQHKFSHRTQGCPLHEDTNWCFYRYHVDDPVWFDSDCRVTLQNLGGAPKRKVLQFLARGAKLEVVTINPDKQALILLRDQKKPLKLEDPSIPGNTWCNYYRQDDLSATAYFYLDRPASNLPALQPLEERIAEL